jgi:hypothetical protein
MPGRTVSDEYTAVVAKRLGDDRVTTLLADSEEIILVRPTPISAGGAARTLTLWTGG